MVIDKVESRNWVRFKVGIRFSGSGRVRVRTLVRIAIGDI